MLSIFNLIIILKLSSSDLLLRDVDPQLCPSYLTFETVLFHRNVYRLQNWTTFHLFYLQYSNT